MARRGRISPFMNSVLNTLWLRPVLRMKDDKLGVGRFMIEFLRGDIARGFVGALSTSQFISVFTALLGAWLIWRRQQKNMIE